MVAVFAGIGFPIRSTRTGASAWARHCLYLLSGLFALCAMLLGPVAFAEDRGPGQSNPGAAVQADQDIETTLREVTRQITIGHTLGPEGDNALATWMLMLKSALP